jgi:hypothetical protein
MAITFNNSSKTNIDNTFVEVYKCNEPATKGIIISMTISNKLNDIITVSAKITGADGLTTVYLLNDALLPPNSSIVLAGDEQKIIVNQFEKIEVLCSDANGVDVALSFIEDDPTIEYFGPVYLWYGDKGLVFGGGSYSYRVDGYDFPSGTIYVNEHNLSYYAYYSGSSSNATIGLIVGGRTINTIKSMEFASNQVNYNFSQLNSSTYYINASSDGISHLTWGGYSYKNTIQKGTFTAGEICASFGLLTYGRYYCYAAGNSIYSIIPTGYSTSYISTMFYVEYATESNSMVWGNNLYYRSLGATPVAREDMMVWHRYGTYTRNSYIDKIDFASQGNAVAWAYLSYYNYELGAMANETTILFLCGEYYNYSYEYDYDSNVEKRRFGGF